MMATCKDCVHHDWCFTVRPDDFDFLAFCGQCGGFKDKAKYVEQKQGRWEESTVDAVVLPCMLGNRIYQTDGIRIYESTISEITLTKSRTIYVTENVAFDESAIGKSVFLTREEAEAALAKMG